MSDIDLEQMITAVREYFPSLTLKEQQIAFQAYQLLAKGAPVTRQQLASRLQLSLSPVSETLDRWWGVQFDAADRIIGFWGLTLQPTTHRLHINGRVLYTWCAWDTLFIPLILRATAQIESQCPVSQEPIHLTVTPSQVTTVEPDSTTLSFLTPDAGAVKDNIVSNFCHYVFFMSSRDAGTQWIEAHPGTFMMSIEDAFVLGQRITAIQYADVIDRGE